MVTMGSIISLSNSIPAVSFSTLVVITLIQQLGTRGNKIEKEYHDYTKEFKISEATKSH